MSKNTDKGASKGNKGGAPKADLLAQTIAQHLKIVQSKSVDKLSERRVETMTREIASAWGVVQGIVKRGAMLTGKGRDGYGSTDTTRMHFIHECLFNAAYDYDTDEFLPVYGALTGAQIHAFVIAAQVLTGVEKPESITTPSATGSHVRTLTFSFFGEDAKGTARQLQTSDPERASVQSTSAGYVISEAFALQMFESKVKRGELKAPVKKAKAPKKVKAGK